MKRVWHCRDNEGQRADSGQLKTLLRAAADSLKAGVAKCALMSSEIRGDPRVAAPLLAGIQKYIETICALCYSLQVRLGPQILGGRL